MKTTIQVVAALIWKQNKFLICQRPQNKKRALLWEFVGGKVEQGETPEQALVRECKEELAIRVQVQDVFFHTLHEYSDVIVDLTLFNATTTDVPQMLEHANMCWITADQTDNFDFCPADREILAKLKSLG